jgi:hypothetical protein
MTMRLGDTKFFNLFFLLAGTTNPDRTRNAWQVGSIDWARERTTLTGPNFSLQIEVHTLHRPGRRGWTLLAGHETWWDGARKDPFRNGRWVHLSKGSRTDVLAWFAEQEKELD